MKNLIIIKILVAVSILLCMSFTVASASSGASLQDASAQTLVNLRILEGYEDGSLRLENKIKRSEFITVIVRIMGYDTASGVNDAPLPFKDISKNHWAYNYIKTAYKHNLVDGYSDNTVAPDKFVTYAEALSVLVKALGYKDTLIGNWPASVINGAGQLGIDKGVNIPADKQVTRGEISILVKNSLIVDLKQ